MNKVVSYGILFSLIIISSSFFYYYVIFLPNYQKNITEQSRQERETREESAERKRIALNRCLSEADALWMKQVEAITKRGNECTSSGCVQARIESDVDAKIDKDLQQNKDNCFKEFPQ